MSEIDASLFELPYEHIKTHVKPQREAQNDASRKAKWWLHGRSGTDFRYAVHNLKRYIATPRVAKHRLFVWLDICVFPDTRLNIIARSDDTTFGILHSRFHEVWSLATCSWHGVGNDPTYNAKSCFETFPFPPGLTPKDTSPKTDEEKRELGYVPLLGEIHDKNTNTPIVQFSEPTPAIIADPTRRIHAQAIANAAFKLNQLRDNWLNPPEWVDWIITPEEEKAGFPKRPVAKPGHAADLKKRTLTNLYNANPGWLINAHQALDKAVAKAYDWDDYTPEMTDAEILQRLLKLNLAR